MRSIKENQMPAKGFVRFTASLLAIAFALPAYGANHSSGNQVAPPVQSILQQAELTGSDVQHLSNLGYSVAISGNTVVVGAPGGEDDQGNSMAGAVYVYVKPANGWANMTQVAKLTPSDVSGIDGFGFSVAISGNTIVTEASRPELYVFTEPAGGWVDMTETARLTVSPIGLGPCLCGQVAIDGDTIAVGSPIDALGNYGTIQVYTKPTGGWTSTSQPAAVLFQAFAQSEEQSFHSIAISGKTIVGEGLSLSGSTAEYFIYLYLQPETGWNGDYSEQAVLASTQAGNYFTAGGVSTNGTIVVAGSNSPNLNFFPPSFVDVWVEPTGGWAGVNMTESAQLSDGTTSYADGFGTSTAIGDNTIVVGTPSAIVVQSGRYYRGAAYVFNKPSGGWQTTTAPSERLLPSDGTVNDGFGTGVCISGGTIVVGAPYGPKQQEVGEAYVYVK
jgi:hypothetical protein